MSYREKTSENVLRISLLTPLNFAKFNKLLQNNVREKYLTQNKQQV